ncbi:EAL domain-containing protein [Geotalea sp. SG265]|uniref:bifunctional diguanylate cyclase/phosphodiesterase n=1 Tax=Geotalea sp. SG265 TaxID=2922867 RepID=UPI001FAEA775|nr:EAL domain-containing protein [Geotalea sp. SG265]
MALAVSALFICSLAILAFLSISYMEGEYKQSIARQQYTLVSALAENVDDKLRIAQNALAAAAANIPPDKLRESDKAQRFLDAQYSLLALFDNALFIFSPKGSIIAESPYIEGRRGRDISFRDYYKETVKSGKPVISSPYFSTHNPGQPCVILTVPIFGTDGKLTAIFAGSFNLLGQNFLEDLSHTRIGQTGYVYLFDNHRTIIIHPDKTRIMHRDVPVGINRLFDRSIAGFEGSGETRNSKGIETFSSFRHLRTTNWILAASFPIAEAYAPLKTNRIYFVTVMVAGAAVTLILVWFLMQRLTAPLSVITRHVEAVPKKPGVHNLIDLDRKDELGTLIKAFNRMAISLDQHQNALQESESNFRALADNANDGLHIITGSNRLAYVNRRAAEIIGYTVEEMLFATTENIVHPDHLPVMKERTIRKEAGEPVPEQFETMLAHKDGSCIPVEVTTARTLWQGKQAELAIVRDITDRKKAAVEIQQLAYYDTLTGLPNRSLLHDRINQSIVQAVRCNRKVGILFLDLDRFKGINDTLGHLAGDGLLAAVAERLMGCIRETDTVARIGGDEFVIIIPALEHTEDLSKVAEKILAVISKPLDLKGKEIFITASMGIAVYPDDGNDVYGLLKNADFAMYQAKDQGKNAFQYYSQELNAQALEHLMLESDLRRALERNEFVIYYQPQMDLNIGRVVGMEALLRWQHPDLGLLPPSRFISLAEETGLILPIGEWALETACAKARKLLDMGLTQLRVAVNFSGSQFRQKRFVEMVEAVLQKTGLTPLQLELELTESMIMSNAEENTNVLRKLKEMGVSLAIDDFGTGYSSLSYLKHFPIDRVKIDQMFIRDVPDSADDSAIVSAIIAMAHNLNLKVTAEGVENMNQLEFLCSRNCNEIQGYVLSAPLSEVELTRFLWGA